MKPWYLEHLGHVGVVYFDMPHTTLDFETTNREKGSALVPENRIVLACVSNGGPAEIGEPSEILPRRTVLVAHNAKFELLWLNRIGIDTSQYLVWDTMLAEYVLAGNRRWPLDLGSVCRRYGLPAKEPVIDSLMSGGVCPSEMPRHLLEARVRRDVETTDKLFLLQRERLREEGLLGAMFTRCALSPVLAEIEATGLFVDKKAVSAETRRVFAELRRCEASLGEMTGGINLRSTAQMAHYLYGIPAKTQVHPDFTAACALMENASMAFAPPRRSLGFAELTDRRGNPRRNAPTKQFPSGLPKTDNDTLDKLKATTPEQKAFIKARAEFGDWNARYTKTLQFLDAVARDYDGIVYARLNQSVVQTHRLSSSGRKIPVVNPETGKTEERGIQFQNVQQEYKKLFTSREPDYVMVEIDAAKLEFVVAGFLGQDKQVAHDLLTGQDVHRFTASWLFDIPEEEVTKKQRTAAKAFTFGPLFGKVSGTKREMAYYEAFREKYHQIETTQKKWISTVLATKKLKTASGLTFYWPGCKEKNDGYVEHSTNIKNYPIQSLATAEIIPASMTALYWAVKSHNLRVLFVNQVHDSVVMECHHQDVDKLRALAETAFLESTYEYLDKVYGIKFNLPLGIAFTAGSHWGEGEEISVSRPNPLTPPLVP